jgi:NADP-dependent 3-hydroxy acid dehydrogenase YdfG
MIDDFQIKSLGELSTNFDVLKALQATKQFAPYVGSQGVAVITGGTGGIGLPVSRKLHEFFLPLSSTVAFFMTTYHHLILPHNE